MTDLYDTLEEMGIDQKRLAVVMEPKAEQWGQLVHAFEVVATLSAVLKHWPEKDKAYRPPV